MSKQTKFPDSSNFFVYVILYIYFLNMQGRITKSVNSSPVSGWGTGLTSKGPGMKTWDEVNKMKLKRGHIWHFHVSREMPFLGHSLHPSLSRKSAWWVVSLKCCTLMHTARGINMRRSVCSCRATSLLRSQRLSGMAPMTGVLQWRDMGFSGEKCQKDEGKLAFMWENTRNARSCDLGLMITWLKAYG